MTDAIINVEGTIIGRRTGQYENKPFGVVQLQALDREAVKLIEINLAEGFDMSRFPRGSRAKIPVSIGASKDGRKIYYREIPATESANAKSATDALRKQPVSL